MKTLLSTNNMRIDYFFEENSNCQNLAYVFTPSMNRNLIGNAYGGEVFMRSGFDTIAFKISNDDWFQSIPLELFDKIKSLILERGYIKRISYGSSMGGYASIALSKYLNCTTSIAFSPQFSIDEEFDKRWKNHAKKIQFKYRISLESINNDCKFFIFYDNKDLDALQVEKLLDVLPYENTKLIKLPYTGHPSVQYLSEVGLIKHILISIAQQDSVEGIEFLASKRISKSYFHALSVKLFRKKHFIWALATINLALKIDTQVASFYNHQSLVLSAMDRLSEAIDSIKKAIAVDPNNSYQYNQLSILLYRQNLIDEAVAASKSAISLDSNNPHFYGQLSKILLKINLNEDALSAINSAIKIDAGVAGFHHHKSVVLIKLGDVSEARKSLEAAIALEPINLRHLIT